MEVFSVSGERKPNTCTGKRGPSDTWRVRNTPPKISQRTKWRVKIQSCAVDSNKAGLNLQHEYRIIETSRKNEPNKVKTNFPEHS